MMSTTLTVFVTMLVFSNALQGILSVDASESREKRANMQADYSDEEKEKMWKASLSCFKRKQKIDLRKIAPLSYVPQLYAPPYWTQFGPQLCKWTRVKPISKNNVTYFGGYFSTNNESKVHTYTGKMKYNLQDKVYNVEEYFTSTGKTSVFSVVPCVVSKDTFMFYIPTLTKNNTCVHQTFVFSTNSKSNERDKKKLESKCFKRYFNISAAEMPYEAKGCTDIGLF